MGPEEPSGISGNSNLPEDKKKRYIVTITTNHQYIPVRYEVKVTNIENSQGFVMFANNFPDSLFLSENIPIFFVVTRLLTR